MGPGAAAAMNMQFHSPGIHNLQPNMPNGGLQRQVDGNLAFPGMNPGIMNGQMANISAKNSFGSDKDLQNYSGMMNMGNQVMMAASGQNNFQNLGSMANQPDQMSMRSNSMNFSTLSQSDSNLGTKSAEKSNFDILQVYENTEKLSK